MTTRPTAMAKAHYRLAQVYRKTGQDGLANEEFARHQRLKEEQLSVGESGAGMPR